MKRYAKAHKSLTIAVAILAAFAGVIVAAEGVKVAYQHDRDATKGNHSFLTVPAARNAKVSNSAFVQSQESAAIAATESLTGKRVAPEKAAKSADAIVVATLVDPGIPNANGPGESYWWNATIGVTRTLKGDFPTGLQKISFVVTMIPGKVEEHLPAKGVPHIFFLKKVGTDFKGIKILRATDANLQLVANLLS